MTEIARLESGHTPSRRRPEWWGGDVPWIGIKDARAHHGRVIEETLENTNPDGLANSAARLLPAGTVCLSRTASVGYVTVMGRDMATSQDFVNWICSDAVDPHWLAKLFIAEERALSRFSKGSTHSTIYFPEVKAFHVCLPPLETQLRIVAALDAIHARTRAARAALEAVPAQVEKFRRSVLAAAFRGDLTADWRAKHPDVEPASALLERIRVERRVRWIEDYADKHVARAAKRAAKAGKPWGDEQAAKKRAEGAKKGTAKYVEPEPVDAAAEGLPELPETWCWARLEELASWQERSIQSGPFGSALKHSEFVEEGHLVIGIDNVQDGEFSVGRNNRISPAKFAELSRFQARPGDVLITVMATIGRCAVVPFDLHEALVSKHVYRITLWPGVVRPRFLMDALRGSTDVLQQMGANTRGQTRPGINGTVLKGLAVPLPPVVEQEAVDGAVLKLAARPIGLAARAGLEQVATLERSALAKAFRGELVR